MKESLDLRNCPNIMNLEQLRKVAHISKRKASALLSAKLIPCIDNGQRTHRYSIKKKDVAAYIIDREINPENYNLKNANLTITGSRRNNSYMFDITKEACIEYYKKRFEEYPDLLEKEDLPNIIGYGNDRIELWIREKRIFTLDCLAGLKIPKCCLIEFMSDPWINNMPRKSVIHKTYIAEIAGYKKDKPKSKKQ